MPHIYLYFFLLANISCLFVVAIIIVVKKSELLLLIEFFGSGFV